jgi:hypothetical protein
MTPNAADIPAYVAHYRACKPLAPRSTAACILVPSGTDPLLLQGMRLVCRYPVGTCLFHVPDVKGSRALLPPISEAMEVWYDGPEGEEVIPSCSAEGNAVPHLPVKIAGSSFMAMLDSGATHSFVSEALVRLLHLHILPTTYTYVRLADGGTSPIVGQTMIKVRVGPVRLVVPALVMKGLPTSTDLILGANMLEQGRMVIDFDTRVVVFRKGTEEFRRAYTYGKVNPSEDQRQTHHVIAAMQAGAECLPVNRKQAKNMVRKGRERTCC